MNNYQSRYCYPGSDVLINNFNAKNQKQLDILEAGYTAKRLMDLQKNPLKGNFDLKHLQNIHKYIFQDIYPFAGELRTENIGKDSFRFALCKFIEPAAEELFARLKNEKYLSGLDLKEFSDRAAYYMAEINVLHPFREGNGRAQRELIRTLSLRNGYELNWSLEPKEFILDVSIRSKDDSQPLANVIEKCIENTVPNLAIKKSFNFSSIRGNDR